MSILITTYEGTHNHPLPASATAMASTTSAAASMLLSGSSTSGSGQSPPAAATTGLHRLNSHLSDPSRLRQFYLPYSSPITPSPSHPTITLDLTSGAPAISSSSYLNQFSSGANYYSSIARYNNPSTTSLNFSSSESISSQPISWGKGLPNFGAAHHELFNKTNPQESLPHHLPRLQKTNNNNPQESIAAVTEAITTDPNFQSALVAALKSIINAGSSSASGSGMTPALGNYHGGAGGDVLGQKLRWNESLTTPGGSLFGQMTAPKANACGSSYLNKSSAPSTGPHHQPASLMFLQSNPTSLPFSSSKQNAAAASPVDNGDRNC